MDRALATRVAGAVTPGQASSPLLGHHAPRLTRWAPGAPRVTVTGWCMRLVAGLQLQEDALTCGLGLSAREVTFAPEIGSPRPPPPPLGLAVFTDGPGHWRQSHGNFSKSG